jgi:hypothetical protein
MLRAGPPSTANHPNDTVTCLDHAYTRSEWSERVFDYAFKYDTKISNAFMVQSGRM